MERKVLNEEQPVTFLLFGMLNSSSPLPHHTRLVSFSLIRYPSFITLIWDWLCTLLFWPPLQFESHGPRLEELKQAAKELLATVKEHCDQLDLINTMQRLGVAYHFEKDIKDILAKLVDANIASDLYTVALQFRLLRQNGFFISTGYKCK